LRPSLPAARDSDFSRSLSDQATLHEGAESRFCLLTRFPILLGPDERWQPVRTFLYEQGFPLLTWSEWNASSGNSRKSARRWWRPLLEGAVPVPSTHIICTNREREFVLTCLKDVRTTKVGNHTPVITLAVLDIDLTRTSEIAVRQAVLDHAISLAEQDLQCCYYNREHATKPLTSYLELSPPSR
jgi:hypothetical protein